MKKVNRQRNRTREMREETKDKETKSENNDKKLINMKENDDERKQR